MIAIFGYGSLVHTATHNHAALPAVATGWRRVWREVPGRDFAILSVEEAPGATLKGAVIFVQETDLPALDEREALYVRQPAQVHNLTGARLPDAQIYIVTPYVPGATAPIIRSYLDVVLAGFNALHGPEAANDFYATTSGWHRPVAYDRTSPIYPRAQPIRPEIAASYDALHKKHAPGVKPH